MYIHMNTILWFGQGIISIIKHVLQIILSYIMPGIELYLKSRQNSFIHLTFLITLLSVTMPIKS